MSALKKYSNLRWTFRNELTPKGNISATNWHATVGKYRLLVVNYPGTKSLEWEITIPGTYWRNGNCEDRFEFTVSRLKDFVFDKVSQLIEKEKAESQ